ncbi:hypothetical protein J4456_01010 [Candidatus Pacearchaeota archaeon]|nr:hypothetical protein [Candidatus Pacearchaeota archaeon]
MSDPRNIQIVIQLIDNLQNATDKLERSYSQNSSEVDKLKDEIEDIHKKISGVLSQNVF